MKTITSKDLIGAANLRWANLIGGEKNGLLYNRTCNWRMLGSLGHGFADDSLDF